MLIFQPVFPKYYSQHLTLDLWGVKKHEKITWLAKEGTWKDVFFVNDDSTHGN